MQRAGQVLLGENDFTSFRAVQCQSRSPWRNVMHLNVSRFGAYVVVDIKANAFVHHMVRNIVGSLMEIGCGNQQESWMAELLAAKDRTLAAATAKLKGFIWSPSIILNILIYHVRRWVHCSSRIKSDLEYQGNCYGTDSYRH